MSLKPFWKSHPKLMRFTAAAMLLVWPLMLTYYMFRAVWEYREEIASELKQLWRYAAHGP